MDSEGKIEKNRALLKIEGLFNKEVNCFIITQ